MEIRRVASAGSSCPRQARGDPAARGIQREAWGERGYQPTQLVTAGDPRQASSPGVGPDSGAAREAPGAGRSYLDSVKSGDARCRSTPTRSTCRRSRVWRYGFDHQREAIRTGHCAASATRRARQFQHRGQRPDHAELHDDRQPGDNQLAWISPSQSGELLLAVGFRAASVANTERAITTILHQRPDLAVRHQPEGTGLMILLRTGL